MKQHFQIKWIKKEDSMHAVTDKKEWEDDDLNCLSISPKSKNSNFQ